MIADILGLSNKTVQSVLALNDRLVEAGGGGGSGLRGRGSARDLASYVGPGPVSVPVRSAAAAPAAEGARWVWARVKNSAHPAGEKLHLHRWTKVGEAVKNEQKSESAPAPCCMYTAREDSPAAGELLSRSNCRLRYDDALFEAQVQPLLSSSSWSRRETDMLFELARIYDLRFCVITDRYNLDLPPEFMPRPLEQLKDRYYSVARVIVNDEFAKRAAAIDAKFAALAAGLADTRAIDAQRAQMLAETREAAAKHPIMKMKFDLRAEVARREALDNAYQTTPYRVAQANRRLLSAAAKAELALNRKARTEALAAAVKKRGSVSGGGGSSASSSLSGSSATAAAGGAGSSGAPDEAKALAPLDVTPYPLTSGRKPGPILASQLRRALAASVGAALAAQHGSGAGGGHASAAHSSAPGALSALQRKQEILFEQKLRELNFLPTGEMLGPADGLGSAHSRGGRCAAYTDLALVEAFQSLRTEVASLVYWEMRAEIAAKERSAVRNYLTARCAEERTLAAPRRPAGGPGGGAGRAGPPAMAQSHAQQQMHQQQQQQQHARRSKHGTGGAGSPSSVAAGFGATGPGPPKPRMRKSKQLLAGPPPAP